MGLMGCLVWLKQVIRFHMRSPNPPSVRRLAMLVLVFLVLAALLNAYRPTAAAAPPQSTPASHASKWAAQLPGGDAKSVILATCQACHNLEQVVTAEHSKEEWKNLMEEMVDRGARLKPDEIPVVIDYLATNFGPEGAAAGSPMHTPQSGEASLAASVIDPDQAQFSAAPEAMGLPTGVQSSVLAGDPAKPAPFSMLLKLPAGQVISPRSFSADENIVCLRGAFQFGEGNNFDPAKLRTLSPGALVHIPAQIPYFSQANESTIILVYGSGPFSTMTPK